MRRRLQLIPCRFQTNTRDDTLFDTLMTEWPAIARWIVEGAVKWYRQGLKPPKIVTEASDQYISSQDTKSQWVKECCTEDPNARATPTKLWQSWIMWCERRRLKPGTPQALSEWLTKRYGDAKPTTWTGIDGKRHSVRLYQGIDVENASFEGPENE
jgi:putative DNA primase/helicase